MDRTLKTLILTALLAGLGACSSYRSPTAFQDAREKARESDRAAQEVVSQIVRELSSIPAEHRSTAIDTVASIPGPSAEGALFTMLEHPSYQTQPLRERIIQQLADRAQPGTANRLFEIYRQKPEFMNDDLMLLLGREQVTQAIPDIKNYIEGNRYIFTGLRSLGLMNHESADEYLLLVATNETHPGRPIAVENLGRVRSDRFQKQAERYVLQLLNNPDLDSHNVYVAAIRAMGHQGYRKDNHDLLKKIYDSTPDEKVRNQALEALAQMRGMDSHLMARDLHMPLAQGTLAQYDPYYSPAPRPSAPKKRPARKPQRRVVKKAKKKAALEKSTAASPKKNGEKAESNGKSADLPGRSTEYRRKLQASLSQSMSPETAAAVLKQINNAFLAYSNYDDSSSRFVRRSFTKFYNISDDDSKDFLSRGLFQDQSLHAVLKNILAEYKTPDMRAYAVSRLFSIPRWQASILVEFAQKGQL